MFFRFFLYTFFLKSLNFRSVDTLSAQLHCHMDYFIYWRHANSTHLPYSSFVRNFEFTSVVIRMLRSTKSQNFTILLFSNFIQQKSGGGHGPPGPPGFATSEQVLVIRSLLEFYLFLVVVRYSYYIDFSQFCHRKVYEQHSEQHYLRQRYCSVYFLPGHKIEHYHCHELRFTYCKLAHIFRH